jgi:hypothetical protein
MRIGVGIIVLLGLALSAITLVVLKGGIPMSMRLNDTEAGTRLSVSDSRFSSTFETATFALG